ncbi:hypothetical protein HBI56_199190 [Parastagonospora nodorum]|uniref:Uncharacterized protein n=1 Tax=Phaeosphaeria nodorum (strain SN15 / ATCC MYA-4574 / FGSC 10173) TaxID=321614 RepID=A0A7U2FAG0_PHANO|nr:hypothetical protein HBH56_204170 [Parastagonospora nodorum]QRD01694.1 hypothetical protein JI435_417150 [Parastagonospora nodorum SN15]KAH3923953.1 hypothetical protein HBH54_203050 [Parastagonospora nodorum]KAH3941455.1 hypothetical protein HBH53_201270 [Parastagonospora nodorum]KAH3959508.1 hypothetical protein HBH51_199270 [Parastagonospora nodorum]
MKLVHSFWKEVECLERALAERERGWRGSQPMDAGSAVITAARAKRIILESRLESPPGSIVAPQSTHRGLRGLADAWRKNLRTA